MQKKLTDSYVERLKPTPKVLRIWDVEVKGFGLRVTPAGQTRGPLPGQLRIPAQPHPPRAGQAPGARPVAVRPGGLPPEDREGGLRSHREPRRHFRPAAPEHRGEEGLAGHGHQPGETP